MTLAFATLAVPTSATANPAASAVDGQLTVLAGLQPLRLLSTSDTGTKSNAISLDVDLSADGLLLAFTSQATNLDPADTDNTSDVYLKNAATGALDLVSTSDNGTPGNDTSGEAQVVGGGDTVVFLSFATNLDPGDVNGIGLSDIFVKSVSTGDLRLVSTSDSGASANSGSGSPSGSEAGTLVAFDSFATNLDPGDADSASDVYVKGLSTGDIRLASTSDSGLKADDDSFEPTLSGSGSRVAFTSVATNLDPADSNANGDVYVKDLASGDLLLVSTSDSGTVADRGAGSPSISSAGGRVAFESFSANLDPADADGLLDVYVKTLATGNVQVVSTSDRGVKGNGISFDPVISADGRRVAFASSSTNLDPADRDARPDIHVKDLQTGDIALASTTADGVHADGVSGRPALSGQGRRVAFDTTAANLDPADQDSEFDVYLGQPLVCTAAGTSGPDVLVGTAGADVLCGRGGRDTLSGVGGNDVLLGEGGADTLSGGAGADVLDGGAGSDGASYADSPVGVEVDLALGVGSGGDAAGDTLTGMENLTGSGFADSMFGDGAANVLGGGGGPDVLAGAAGADTLLGDTGEDFLVGGADADRLTGGPAGAADEDTVTYSESPVAVAVDLRLGTAAGGTAEGDTFTEIDSVVGSPFEDELTGDAADNTLTGGAGNDILLPDAGADTLIGGTGVDLVSYADSPAGVTVDLTTQSVSGGDANGDVIETIDGAVGSLFFADSLTGDAFDNVLFGLGGDDTLRGLAGTDIFNGGTGTDSCDGEPDELVLQCET